MSDELQQRIHSAMPGYVFFHNIDTYLNSTGAMPDPLKLGCESVDEAYDLVFSVFSLIVKRELEEVELSMHDIEQALEAYDLKTDETLTLKEIGIRIVIEILMHGSMPMIPYRQERITFITSQSSIEEKGRVIYKPTQQGLKFYFSTHEYEAYLENLSGMRFEFMLLEEKINAGDYQSAIRNTQRIYAAIVTQLTAIQEFYERIAASPLTADIDEIFKEKHDVIAALNDANERLKTIVKHAESKIEGLLVLNDEEKKQQYAPALREVRDISARCINKDAETISLYMGLDTFWQDRVLEAAQADHPQRFNAAEITTRLEEGSPFALEDLFNLFFIKPLPKTFALSRLDETKEESEESDEDHVIKRVVDPVKEGYRYDQIASVLLAWIRDHLALSSSMKLSEMMPYPHELVAAKEETGGFVTSVLIDLFQSCNGLHHEETPLDHIRKQVECPAFTIKAIKGTCSSLDGELDHDLLFEVRE
jgi:predicted acetyltransferase